VSTALVAFAAAQAADVPLRWTAYWVLLAGAAALAGSAAVQRWRRSPAEVATLELTAHLTAGCAVIVAEGSVRHMAGLFTLWGVALGLRALFPGAGQAQLFRWAGQVPVSPGRLFAAVAAQLVAAWLLLAAEHVALLEAYTVPGAALGVLGGWLVRRSRPQLRSWPAYGPALLAGIGPSLVSTLNSTDPPLRRLLLGAAAVGLILLGSARRLQAPVVVGGVTIVIVALHEVALVWDLLPRWIPLGVAGILLVSVAIRYERRRRDLSRLRERLVQLN